MDTTQEQAYAQAEGPNRAMSPKLGSKEGTNRDATRGASEDVIDQGQKRQANPGYAFFGAKDGRNDDTFHTPAVKKPTTPSLNAPEHKASLGDY